jgi:hypothetical protein
MEVSSGSPQIANLPAVVMDRALVEAEKARLKKMFVEIDTNRDGKIDVQELTQGLRKMGYFHITAEQIEVQALIFHSFILILNSALFSRSLYVIVMLTKPVT